MGLIEQTVSSWEGWPADVAPQLRAWNAAFLLSFRRTGDFVCAGCARAIAGHPSGNAVVRPAPKLKGSLFCESCLVALARTYSTPPPYTERGDVGVDERRSYRGALARAQRREETMLQRLARQRESTARLARQLVADQIYIDELEKLVAPDRLAALRDTLRGHRRRR